MKRKNKALTRNAHKEGTGLSEQNCQIHVISLLEHVLYKSAKGNKGHCCQRRSSEAVTVTVFPCGLSLEAGEWNHTSGECSLPSEPQGRHCLWPPNSLLQQFPGHLLPEIPLPLFLSTKKPWGRPFTFRGATTARGILQNGARQSWKKWTWAGRGIVCTQCLQYLYPTACPPPASVSSL